MPSKAALPLKAEQQRCQRPEPADLKGSPQMSRKNAMVAEEGPGQTSCCRQSCYELYGGWRRCALALANHASELFGLLLSSSGRFVHSLAWILLSSLLLVFRCCMLARLGMAGASAAPRHVRHQASLPSASKTPVAHGSPHCPLAALCPFCDPPEHKHGWRVSNLMAIALKRCFYQGGSKSGGALATSTS